MVCDEEMTLRHYPRHGKLDGRTIDEDDLGDGLNDRFEQFRDQAQLVPKVAGSRFDPTRCVHATDHKSWPSGTGCPLCLRLARPDWGVGRSLLQGHSGEPAVPGRPPPARTCTLRRFAPAATPSWQ